MRVLYYFFQEHPLPATLLLVAAALGAGFALKWLRDSLEESGKRRAAKAAHRSFLVGRFGADIADRIMRGEVWEGATLEMMSESLGKPRIGTEFKANLGDGVFKFLGPDHARPVEVRFRAGVVVSWTELEEK